MRILVINGSPNSSGNTAGLIDKVVSAARAAAPDSSVERVSLNELTYRGCQGCLQCLDASSHGCSQVDALTPVLRRMAEADALIVGTPLYMSGVAGQTKMFLDRLCAFPRLRVAAPGAVGPRTVLAITQGVGDPDAYVSVVKQVTSILSHQCGATVESIVGSGFVSGQAHSLAEEAVSRASSLGKWLVDQD